MRIHLTENATTHDDEDDVSDGSAETNFLPLFRFLFISIIERRR